MKTPGVIERLHQSLDYHQARHAVLAANLANVDTPGYRARDVERTNFTSELSSAMRATDPRHIGAASSELGTRVVVDETTPADPDGNAVSLDKETVKISANHLRYETVATLISAELASLHYAATDGRGA